MKSSWGENVYISFHFFHGQNNQSVSFQTDYHFVWQSTLYSLITVFRPDLVASLKKVKKLLKSVKSAISIKTITLSLKKVAQGAFKRGANHFL